MKTLIKKSTTCNGCNDEGFVEVSYVEVIYKTHDYVEPCKECAEETN
jgi:hypothetical protein